MAQRYWASGKDGIVVRGLMSLDSKVVGDLACGTPLSVMGFGELPCGKRRARLVHPVKGWCSAKLISPAGTPAWDLPRRPDGSRPRVLCLHGGATSGAIFRAQLHAIVEDLKEAVDFVFEDGPLSAPTTGPEAKHMRSFFPGLVKGGLFSWMSIVEVSEDGREEDVVASVLRRERDDRAPGGRVDDDLRSGVVHGSGAVLVGTKDAAGGDQQYRNEGAALKRVLELVCTHRPDGIVGFSQGANVAALLFAALQAGHASVPSPPRFLVALCATHWGWKRDVQRRTDTILRDADLRGDDFGWRFDTPLFEEKLRVPSLHVINDHDPRRRFSLSFRDDLFLDPQSATANIGHKPPNEPRFADVIHDFAKAALAPEASSPETASS